MSVYAITRHTPIKGLTPDSITFLAKHYITSTELPIVPLVGPPYLLNNPAFTWLHSLCPGTCAPSTTTRLLFSEVQGDTTSKP